MNLDAPGWTSVHTSLLALDAPYRRLPAALGEGDTWIDQRAGVYTDADAPGDPTPWCGSKWRAAPTGTPTAPRGDALATLADVPFGWSPRFEGLTVLPTTGAGDLVVSVNADAGAPAGLFLLPLDDVPTTGSLNLAGRSDRIDVGGRAFGYPLDGDLAQLRLLDLTSSRPSPGSPRSIPARTTRRGSWRCGRGRSRGASRGDTDRVAG